MVGQTGSGKTYTMLGNSSDLTTAAGPGEAGLIPRICVELFQRLGLSSAGGGGSTDSYRSGQASIQVLFCEVRPPIEGKVQEGGWGRTEFKQECSCRGNSQTTHFGSRSLHV